MTPEEEKDKLEREGKKQLMKDAKKAGKVQHFYELTFYDNPIAAVPGDF